MTHSMPEDVFASINAVVRSTTGRAVTDTHTLRGDRDYWIVCVDTAGGDRLIVKLASSALVPSFEAAKAKHDLIRNVARIPMAEMIAGNDSQSQVPFRYSIQTQLVGEEWVTRRDRLDQAERERALANLGDIVGRLHQPELPGFGTLPQAHERACLPALLAHSRTIVRDESLAARFSDRLERDAGLWAQVTQPAITHDDLHGFNVLFHPDRPLEVSGILDFDKAWSGPSESDLARMELWRGMSGPSFLAAYRDRIPELPGYGERRPFYQLLWCLEFAQDTEDHLATTNALLAQLGLPTVQSFN